VAGYDWEFNLVFQAKSSSAASRMAGIIHRLDNPAFTTARLAPTPSLNSFLNGTEDE
jgi:hypothetical protein